MKLYEQVSDINAIGGIHNTVHTNIMHTYLPTYYL